MGNHLHTAPGLVSALALFALGCGGSDKNVKDPAEMQGEDGQSAKLDPTLCDTDNKVVEKNDLNGDGKPDVWNLYVVSGGSRTQTCQQVDLDHDGRIDLVTAFNKNGGRVFEKADLTFDGKFDTIYKYEEQPGNTASLVYEIQRDINADGRYDVTEKYNIQGQITSLVRDRNGDQKPDLWEEYEGGRLVAILYDDEPYDGTVDRREEIKKKEDEAKPAADTPPPTGDGAEATEAGKTEAAAPK